MGTIHARTAKLPNGEDIKRAALRPPMPMNWQERARPIKVGDRVAYSAAFLQNTGQFAGDLPHAKGLVVGLVQLGETTLAEIDWDTPEIPRRVNVANLCQVGGRGYSAE